MPLVPVNLLRWMSAEDRRKYAKGQLLPEEIAEACEVAAESELHEQIMALLNRREVPYVHAPMFRKSKLPKGWPDFAFAYIGIPIGFECKVGREKIKPHQAEMHERMRRNGWIIYEIRSLAQAQAVFIQLDEIFNLHQVVEK